MANEYNINWEPFSKELKLLLFVLRLENNKDLLLHTESVFEGIDWDEFIRLIRHHRVNPVIFTKLKKVEHSFIPSYVLQTLYKEYQKNTFQMLKLSGEMEQLSRLFTENQISLLFLKGPVIAVDLYGDISLRTSNDLDVMVPIHCLESVDGLLLKLGYVKDDYFSTFLNEWRWRHHHVSYFHPQKGIKLEIHWRLNPGPAKEPNFHELWERRRTSSLSSYPIYLLGKEDLFLFLASHGARHGWSRLRWLVDIHQIAKQEMDWNKVTQLMKKYHYLQIGGQVLILASKLLNTPLTKEMKELIKGDRVKRLALDALFYIKQTVNLHTNPVPDDIARYHKHHLFSLMSRQQKFLFVMSFFYPYPMDAEVLPLPKNLHFLYFPLRPLLWAWRRTRQRV